MLKSCKKHGLDHISGKHIFENTLGGEGKLLQLGIPYSWFGIRFKYSVFTVFQDLKNFQDIKKPNSTKANTKRKILL